MSINRYHSREWKFVFSVLYIFTCEKLFVVTINKQGVDSDMSGFLFHRVLPGRQQWNGYENIRLLEILGVLGATNVDWSQKKNLLAVILVFVPCYKNQNATVVFTVRTCETWVSHHTPKTRHQ